MPRFGSLLSKINEKLEEAKISDLNHELGKWVHGSQTYLGNLRSDAAAVGSIIRSESGRFASSASSSGKRLFRPTSAAAASPTAGPGCGGSLPKSLSLPSFSAAASGPSSASAKTREPCKDSKRAATLSPSSKYLYKSTATFFDEVDEALLKGRIDERDEFASEVVEKFIRCVEDPSIQTASVQEVAEAAEAARNSSTRSSREEIRKKLAEGFLSGGSLATDDSPFFSRNGHRTVGNSSGGSGSNNNRRLGDLEVCYINETILEEDDEEENRLSEELRNKGSFEDQRSCNSYSSEEDLPSGSSYQGLPRSRTDCNGFASIQIGAEQEREARIKKLQAEAALALANCHKIARRKFLIEKQRLRQVDEDRLKQLLKGKDRIVQELSSGAPQLCRNDLAELNVATLQVIVNDVHSKIEKLSEELVHLVIAKDELQIEQDSQLVDIDDLSLSLPRR